MASRPVQKLTAASIKRMKEAVQQMKTQVRKSTKMKLAWSWHGFKEGLADEGIPLAGATIGARYGGLRGAALGYAAGGGASIARSYAKGEKPSQARKLLAAGALGYGIGGGTHALGEHLTRGAKAGKGLLGKMKPAFHPPKGTSTPLSRTVEEGLPALGATLATGTAMATEDKKKQAMIEAFSDELFRIAGT